MSRTPSPNRDVLAALGIGALLVVCCALPVLLAAGALGALGGMLGSPWLLAAAVALGLAAVTMAVSRHRRTLRRDDAAPDRDDCCARGEDTAGDAIDREARERGEE